MDLYQKVEEKLQKLKLRLNKEGLKTLEHMEYKSYLRTVFWKSIKEWVLNRDNNKCIICESKNTKFNYLEVHHRSYDLEVLEGKNSEMLVSLCSNCHYLVEFYSDGTKRDNIDEKDKELFHLQLLYKEIKSKKLALHINSYSWHKGQKIEISYIGKNEYLTFFSLESLIYCFSINFYQQYRENLKLPLPFGRDKFLQKSGARILNRETKKEVLNIKALENVYVITTSKICNYPVLDHLKGFVSDKDHWKVVQQKII